MLCGGVTSDELSHMEQVAGSHEVVDVDCSSRPVFDCIDDAMPKARDRLHEAHVAGLQER